MTFFQTNCASPLGDLTLVATENALAAVLWPAEPEGRVTFSSSPVAQSETDVLTATANQLHEYFEGRRTTFDLPLDPTGTEFQVQVWRSLATIEYGTTSTYGAQARSIGRPKAVRAVGAANGRNPLSIVLPCHRIVGANGKLTGFAGGLDAKRWLLDHERAHLSR